MEHEFWNERWEKREIGFHESQANPLLVHNFGALKLKPLSRVFVPLCGKSLDVHWFLAQGFCVAGAELSAVAVDELFAELGLEPTIHELGALRHYSAPNIDIYQGDFFELNAEMLGTVDAVYDRAALVALPEPMRRHYTQQLSAVSKNAPQLLITFEYDQSVMPGPPFSISAAEVQQHYEQSYDINALQACDVEGGLKGVCPARETVWLLKSKA